VEWGIRRYGFHGPSVEWCAERVPLLLGRPGDDLSLVVCHLGGGCSVTAVREGHSVDTTMGFSPLEGIPMTTRSGSVDPGALLYVLRERGLDLDAVDHALNLESGVEGLAPDFAGMREIEQAAVAGDRAAQLAIDVFVHRLAGAVAMMAAAAAGLDALVFTAGIGENSTLVRARTCERLAFLGVAVDASRNTSAKPDCDVADEDSGVRVLVISAREDVGLAVCPSDTDSAQRVASLTWRSKPLIRLGFGGRHTHILTVRGRRPGRSLTVFGDGRRAHHAGGHGVESSRSRLSKLIIVQVVSALSCRVSQQE
jgi:acetate kinase